MVSLTSCILSPDIEPLTSITHMRSTLLLAPPEVFIEHIAGIIVSSFSLIIVRWARISISILAYSYLTDSFTFSII